jgi:excinuclease UvrABC ATPase subunit
MEVTMVRYNVTTDCPECDGAGSYAITLDLSSSLEHECPVCDGLQVCYIKNKELTDTVRKQGKVIDMLLGRDTK